MASILVDLQNDVTDPGDGQTTLREAIAAASAGDTIRFAAGLAGGTIVLSQGPLNLSRDINIDGDVNGDDKADITIDGGGGIPLAGSSIFVIAGNGTDVDLHSLHLTNAFISTIVQSGASTLDIVNSSISNNRTGLDGSIGGGILAGAGTKLTMVNSLLYDLHSVGYFLNSPAEGGAVHTRGAATFINTTIHGNSAGADLGGRGGGVFGGHSSILVFINSTVTGNSSTGPLDFGSSGGGIYAEGTLIIRNTVVAENRASSSSDIAGTYAAINSQVGGVTGLGELLDNGGAVLTRSPLDGSLLIAGGANVLLPDTDPFDLDGDGITAEQLPIDGRGAWRIVGATVDIGAVEQIIDEVINGTSGGNTIRGGLGDDILQGGAGGDVLDGGAGSDTATHNAAAAGVTAILFNAALNTGDAAGDTYISIENLEGSPQSDVLIGTFTDNVLRGLTGVDSLNGGAGADILVGGANGDVLNGNIGNDTASYLTASAAVTAVLFNAALNTGDAAGDTYISIENLEGSQHADMIIGTFTDNILGGLAGNDFLNGGAGNDRLLGGADDDQLRGGAGADFLNGGTGVDRVVYDDATTGILVDLVNAELNSGVAAGDSFLFVENLEGSDHSDNLRGTDGANIVWGGAGNDIVVGRGGGDLLLGEEGDDAFLGGAGGDVFVGGGGADRVQYNDSASGLTVDLQFAVNNTGIAMGDRFGSIEHLIGSNFSDGLRGDAGANFLWGADGNDLIFGRDGNDVLLGGAGADVLDGGAQSDVFVFDNDAGTDTINAWEDGFDLISFARIDGITGFADLTIRGNGSTQVTVSYTDDLGGTNTLQVNATTPFTLDAGDCQFG